MIWVAAAIGVTGWIWLLRQVVSPDGFLEKEWGKPRCECRPSMVCAWCLMREGKL